MLRLWGTQREKGVQKRGWRRQQAYIVVKLRELTYGHLMCTLTQEQSLPSNNQNREAERQGSGRPRLPDEEGLRVDDRWLHHLARWEDAPRDRVDLARTRCFKAKTAASDACEPLPHA